jgi:hypothetical protein
MRNYNKYCRDAAEMLQRCITKEMYEELRKEVNWEQ